MRAFKPSASEKTVRDPTGESAPLTQMKSALADMDYGSQVEALKPEIPALSGGGRPLEGAVQTKMESAFKTDFSAVRVHEGPQAASLGAHAYAQGNDIQFASGEYQPSSPSGQTLLGHELAHVVQQRSGRVGGSGVNRDVGLEREAESAGQAAASGRSVGMPETTAVQCKSSTVQRAGLSPDEAETAAKAKMSDGLTEQILQAITKKLLSGGKVKAATIGAAAANAVMAVMNKKTEAPDPSELATAQGKYEKMVKDAALSDKKVTKTVEKTQKAIAEAAANEACMETATLAMSYFARMAINDMTSAGMSKGQKGIDKAAKSALSSISKHPWLKEGGKYRAEAKQLAIAKASSKEKGTQVLNQTLQGKINNKFGLLGKAIDAVVTGDGESIEIKFQLKVPVDPAGSGSIFVGLEMTGEAGKEDGMCTIGASMSFIAGGQIPIPGVDLSAMGKIGGYIEASAPTAADCFMLMSLGLYQRCRDSKIFPSKLTDLMWGLGGLSGGSPKEEAEAWKAMVFDKMKSWGDKGAEAYVESGGLAALEAELGIGEGDWAVGIEASMEVRSGKRIDLANKAGVSHTTFTTTLGVEVGPFAAEGSLAVDNSGLEFEYSVGGAVPVTGANRLFDGVHAIMEAASKAIDKKNQKSKEVNNRDNIDGSESSNVGGHLATIGKVGLSATATQALEQAGVKAVEDLGDDVTDGTGGSLNIGVTGTCEKPKGKPGTWEHFFVISREQAISIDAGIVTFEVTKSKEFLKVPLKSGLTIDEVKIYGT